MTDNVTPLYLSTTQAAEASQRHRETVADALRSGELHGFQRSAGSNWRIDPDCLKAWVEKRACKHGFPQPKSVTKAAA
ncbi:helix-turn-helix domain-containing protein [Agromyces sp. NPDC058104]|uniref:helix-turn-helix domain-containing protein n=1 Tax=Agromyces sp. NPDC058104 TaxID=3346342 RepID=UPI0036DCE108